MDQTITSTRRSRFSPLQVLVALLVSFASLVAFAGNVSAGQGNLLGQTPTIGSYKIKVLGNHYSYAGPAVGDRNHVNVHIIKMVNGGETIYRNYHVTRQDQNGQRCVYVWESQTGAQRWLCIPGGPSGAARLASNTWGLLRESLPYLVAVGLAGATLWLLASTLGPVLAIA